jgi:DNA-binding HxlR family transcriptional regulator
MLVTQKMKVVFDEHLKKTGGKWTYILLYIINKYPIRFNKIKQILPDITARTLSLALSKMQANGLIYRDSDIYKITKLGILTLNTVLDYLQKAKETADSSTSE